MSAYLWNRRRFLHPLLCRNFGLRYLKALASYLDQGYDYDIAKQKADEDIKKEIQLTQMLQWIGLVFVFGFVGMVLLFYYQVPGCSR